MSRFWRIATPLAAAAIGTTVWWTYHSLEAAAAVALTIGLAGFGKRVWSELEPVWSKHAAAWINDYVTFIATRFGRRYQQHLLYKHRTFDIKGFSTQGPHALELEKVFVELAVDATPLSRIPQNPIRQHFASTPKGSQDIFAWLGGETLTDRHFAVVGPPGSGKTTLLKHITLVRSGANIDFRKHIALVLTGRKPPMNVVPIFLSLREHATRIAETHGLTLPALVELTLAELNPPAHWFMKKLESGNSLVMLDGLDEVADPNVRQTVVDWIERQTALYGNNQFVVSSRPNGYRDNPIAGFTVLGVLPFRPSQVERFIRNWYLENELMAYQRDDPGVHLEAQRGADELLSRIRRSPNLQELAINPLLLTLIATVHRFHSELPGRRVELYAQICDVFLGKRYKARGIALDLTPAQRIRILRVLAFRLMVDEVRELSVSEAEQAIRSSLLQVTPTASVADFLKSIEDTSGLLLEREQGRYGFAHLTFQEYLAAVHIKEERLEAELITRIDSPWWTETARLYVAQASATGVVGACIRSDSPSVSRLLLASDCADEALELSSELRTRLAALTKQAVEDSDPQRRQLAAEVMLSRRLKSMITVNDDTYLDDTPISNAEYQLFIDECRRRGQYCQPDHWNSYAFPSGSGNAPVAGIRGSDAIAFCAWLNERSFSTTWTFSLPYEEEILSAFAATDARRLSVSCWITSTGSDAIDLARDEAKLPMSFSIMEERHKTDHLLVRNGDDSPKIYRAVIRIMLLSLWSRAREIELSRHAEVRSARSSRARRLQDWALNKYAWLRGTTQVELDHIPDFTTDRKRVMDLVKDRTLNRVLAEAVVRVESIAVEIVGLLEASLLGATDPTLRTSLSRALQLSQAFAESLDRPKDLTLALDRAHSAVAPLALDLAKLHTLATDISHSRSLSRGLMDVEAQERIHWVHVLARARTLLRRLGNDLASAESRTFESVLAKDLHVVDRLRLEDFGHLLDFGFVPAAYELPPVTDETFGMACLSMFAWYCTLEDRAEEKASFGEMLLLAKRRTK
jgi:hypothetical protein